MISNKVEDAFFIVKKVPCLAEVTKNNHIFSNYAIVNIADNKVLSAVSDDFKLISNEAFLKNVKSISGCTPSWYYTDNRNFYFYAPHKKINSDISIWLEIINSYDGHISKQVNYMLEIEKLYLFTDWKAMARVEDGEIGWNGAMDWEKIIKRWEVSKYKTIESPPFVPHKYLQHLRFSVTDTHLDTIKCYLPLIYDWHLKSFLEARKFSIKLFNHLLT